ncbi:MAG: hypothetical protein V4714_17755 [Bacteroidota bacterium]
MTDSPKYKILKEYPGLPVGQELTRLNAGPYYAVSEGMKLTHVHASVVENAPDYFQLIEEVKWTDSDLERFAKEYAAGLIAGRGKLTVGEWLAFHREPAPKKPYTPDWTVPPGLSQSAQSPTTQP